jgi:tetrahydromethanopterin S-methyltransferase subunit B
MPGCQADMHAHRVLAGFEELSEVGVMTLDERVDRLEQVVLALADARDPAERNLPLFGTDPLTRARNEAEESFRRLADEIRAETHL